MHKDRVNRASEAIKGNIEGWEEFLHDEKVEYLYVNESILEKEYYKVVSKGVLGLYGNNYKVWVAITMIMNRISEIDNVVANKIKYNISNHVNPLKILKEELKNIDYKELDEWHSEQIEILSKVTLNP